MRVSLRLTTVLLSSALLLAGSAQAYNGGPLRNVTDLMPQCAGCHASVGKEQLRVEPEAFAASQLVENKHYKAIEDGAGGYKDMSPADRQKLLADVKAMDENASVTLAVPSTALRPGQEVQVTATVRGGHGVVGVWLMESDLRLQGRAIQADGWVIVGAPRVSGADGKEQTKWVDSRGPGLKKNLNSALIFDQQTDLAAKKFAEGKAVWTLRAPQAPGAYSVVACFQYGTEKASSVGHVTTAAGAILPRGGGGGPSGHIKFSRIITVTVQ
ncbi:MAG: hypothetical protein HY294_14720 [Candidatus Rokubacteria bacterium]|nr:hypothetical protein [Candidatus Rokubacteria bacterium]MBI3827243.1 hypothetical protein [Candidatus Rokubacteria bacterium]